MYPWKDSYLVNSRYRLLLSTSLHFPIPAIGDVTGFILGINSHSILLSEENMTTTCISVSLRACRNHKRISKPFQWPPKVQTPSDAIPFSQLYEKNAARSVGQVWDSPFGLGWSTQHFPPVSEIQTHFVGRHSSALGRRHSFLLTYTGLLVTICLLRWQDILVIYGSSQSLTAFMGGLTIPGQVPVVPTRGPDIWKAY